MPNFEYQVPWANWSIKGCIKSGEGQLSTKTAWRVVRNLRSRITGVKGGVPLVFH
jgi:hypothetical protein